MPAAQTARSDHGGVPSASLPASLGLWDAGLFTSLSCDSPAAVHSLPGSRRLALMAACLPSPRLSPPPPAQSCCRRLVAAACVARTCRHHLGPLHTSRFPSRFLLPSSLYCRLSPSFSLHPDCQRMTFFQRRVKPWFRSSVASHLVFSLTLPPSFPRQWTGCSSFSQGSLCSVKHSFSLSYLPFP